MANYSKQFLEETIKVWQPYYSSVLSLENASELVENMTNLFTLLDELAKKYDKE